MPVNVSLKPECFEPEGYDGLKIWHKPATNLAYSQWIKSVRKMKEVLMPDGTKQMQFDYDQLEFLIGPNEVELAKNCVTSIEGFFVDGDECHDIQTFFDYFPDISVVTAIVMRICNRSKLSEDEEKNSGELQTSQQASLDENLIPTALDALQSDGIN